MGLNTKIYRACHRGMVGSVIWRTFTVKGYSNLIRVSSAGLNLRH